MTVAELIAALEKMPQDATVYLHGRAGCDHVVTKVAIIANDSVYLHQSDAIGPWGRRDGYGYGPDGKPHRSPPGSMPGTQLAPMPVGNR